MLRRLLLIALAAVLLAASILIWGSLGSAVLLLCLITMGSALLYQHFLTHRDEDSFQSSD